MRSDEKFEERKITIMTYFEFFDRAEFEKAEHLLSEHLVVNYPNTREIFRGRDAYIQMNKAYPGRWRLTLQEIEDLGDRVMTISRVISDEAQLSFHAVTFFRFQGKMISEIKEYWGEDGQPPQWRLDQGFSQRY